MPELSAASTELIEQIRTSAIGLMIGKINRRNSDYLILARHQGEDAPIQHQIPTQLERAFMLHLNDPIETHYKEGNLPAKNNYVITSPLGTSNEFAAITTWTQSTTADGDGRRNGINLHLRMPVRLVYMLVDRIKTEPEILLHLNEELFRKGNEKLPAPKLDKKPIHGIINGEPVEIKH